MISIANGATVESGDSGIPWYDMDLGLLAMHLAGENANQGGISYASFVHPVLHLFGLIRFIF